MGPTGEGIAWAAVLVGAVLVLLAPALWNGFPFLFYDSESFIEQALGGGFAAERSVFYAGFLWAAGLKTTIWLPIVVQATLCAAVMMVIARSIVPAIRSGGFAALILALC